MSHFWSRERKTGGCDARPREIATLPAGVSSARSDVSTGLRIAPQRQNERTDGHASPANERHLIARSRGGDRHGGFGIREVDHRCAAGSRLRWEFEDADWFHPAANVDKMHNGIPLTDEDRWPWLDAVAAWIDNDASFGRDTASSHAPR